MSHQDSGTADELAAEQATVGEEVRHLTKQLRGEIQSLTQGDVRRQERLAQFDQHLMQIEASIRDEVTRLRNTGSVVELLAGEVRQAVDGLARLGFDPTHEQLAELRRQIASLPQPDDTNTVTALTALRDQIGAIEEALASSDQDEALAALRATVGEIDARVQSLRTPDLTPLQEGLDQLHVRVAAIPTRDLLPLRDQIDELRSALAELPATLPVVDLAPLLDRLAALHQHVSDLPDAIPAVDLTPLSEQLSTLQTGLRDLPTPDDTAVRAAIATLADQLGELRAVVDQLPRSDVAEAITAGVSTLAAQISHLPAPDDTAVLLGIDRLVAEVDSLRTSTADRFGALPTPEQLAASLAPALGSIRATADPAPVLSAVEQASARLNDQLTALSTAVASTQAHLASLPDHTDDLKRLRASSTQIGQELTRIVEAAALIADQTAPIGSLAAGLASTESEIAALGSRIDAGVAVSREAADAQHLALARVVASADGLSASVGALRAAIGTAADAAGAATVAAVDGRLDDRFRTTEERVAATMTEALRHLDPQPVHRRIDDLSAQISTLPLPDLSPVAAQLARLSATVTSEMRSQGVTPADLDQLAGTFSAAIDRLLARVERQADLSQATAAQVEAAAKATAQRQGEIERRLDALAEQLTRLTELTAQLRPVPDMKAPSANEAASPKRAVADKTDAPAKQAAPKKATITKKTATTTKDRSPKEPSA